GPETRGGNGHAGSRATEGVLAAWLNQLPETQGVSLGPWDRVRIDQYPGRPRGTGRVAAHRRPLDSGTVARRRVRLRPEHRPGRRLSEARREDRPGIVAGAAGRAPDPVPRRGGADRAADAGREARRRGAEPAAPLPPTGAPHVPHSRG